MGMHLFWLGSEDDTDLQTEQLINWCREARRIVNAAQPVRSTYYWDPDLGCVALGDPEEGEKSEGERDDAIRDLDGRLDSVEKSFSDVRTRLDQLEVRNETWANVTGEPKEVTLDLHWWPFRNDEGGVVKIPPHKTPDYLRDLIIKTANRSFSMICQVDQRQKALQERVSKLESQIDEWKTADAMTLIRLQQRIEEIESHLVL